MSENLRPWFVTEPGGPMGRFPGVMEQGGRIIAFTVPDVTTAKELINLRAQLAAAQAIITDLENKAMGANARLAELEAQLAAVPDYVAYYVTAWGPFEAAGGEGTEPLEFDAWLQPRE